MRVSRPILVLAFMGVLVAAAAWFSPPQHNTTQVAVNLPTDLYERLKEAGLEGSSTNGRAKTVPEVIEQLSLR